MTSIIFLPQEVLELCIDELGTDIDQPGSRTALQSCSLAGRRLLTRSQSYLFSTIHITWAKGNAIERVVPLIQNLRRVLEENPDLVSYIRVFEVDVDFNGMVGQPESGLSAIFDMLHRNMVAGPRNRWRNGVHDLRLTGRDLPTNWSNLHPEFRQSIYDFVSHSDGAAGRINNGQHWDFRPPTLRKFHLDFFAVPIDLITRCCESLCELVLDRVWFADNNTFSDADRTKDEAETPSFALTTLRSNESISRFMHALSLSSASPATLLSPIITLQLSLLQKLDIQSAWEVIKLASKSLESLEIGVNGSYCVGPPAQFPGPIDLAAIPHLRFFKLKVHTTVAEYSLKPIPSLKFFLDIFNLKSSASPFLEDIEIHIDVQIKKWPIDPSQIDELWQHDWTTPDALSLTSGKFSGLQKVAIEVHIRVEYDRSYVWKERDHKELQKIRTNVEGSFQDNVIDFPSKLFFSHLVFVTSYSLET
ncbi:hypothetical protein BDZ97DRAFT_139912 [Flammula alnicola]|nr:hypothetical protein BDZ97DRAFT_139912 [Flammula alnicola]